MMGLGRVLRWLRRSSDAVHQMEEGGEGGARFSRSTSRRHLNGNGRPTAMSVFETSRRNSFSGVSTASFEFVEPGAVASPTQNEPSTSPAPTEFVVGDKPVFTGGTADAWMMY
ncbi:hypothetical protein PTSG_10322 [Salpingoeca rosetta]|uniref:Uncharacterized protein n=1 Tax=Salpingoeca rosetta (strain ATCC 50818 / BSB-021) TaxID=946362 RepID=F2UQZ1_SALR5|nr:uncharacterized protein PTSG_10322 [Salpingoeca rosetta]EGD80046.1 hypothetical protein PTSG_10322 [Salpingoeca rosetta]|eukprot:XP_004988371.1 hypothetical protein PTSG_10322 [Salpingoeca rosetta]